MNLDRYYLKTNHQETKFVLKIGKVYSKVIVVMEKNLGLQQYLRTHPRLELQRLSTCESFSDTDKTISPYSLLSEADSQKLDQTYHIPV